MAAFAYGRFEWVFAVLRKVDVELGVWDFDPRALFYRFLAIFFILVFYCYPYCPRLDMHVVRSIVTNFEILFTFDRFQRSFLFASQMLHAFEFFFGYTCALVWRL